MAKNTGNTADKVREIVLPVCEEMGLRLWDVTFEKEGADWFLKVLVEKEDGTLDINECEAFSRKIDPLIDEADPIDQSYFLEVGSPGIERKLRTPEHFERFIGSKVCVRLIRPDSEGKRELEGVLSAFDNGAITLDGKQVNLSDTAFVRLTD
ncbi:MAG: ribosome maturation factor RimP [Ruminococcaceae bacterium]|nr:ribosome maturation factor RimP [Oscillospiraceae bacterium]